MTKIRKSKYKISRSVGTSIWGDAKDPVHKKNYRPGQHGATSVAKSSDYGLHLKAKQRLKAHYGRIREKQFKKIFAEAVRCKGNTGDNFIALLESRLDAAVYRMRIAPTIFAARQIVSHGHILVNSRKVNIASYTLKPGDVIEVKESSKNLGIIADALSRGDRRTPDYYEFDDKKFEGKFLRLPASSDAPYPFEHEVHLVVEFYSR